MKVVRVLGSLILVGCSILYASERFKGFYNRFKNALGFKVAAQPRPRVAEYEAAFSAQEVQKKEPWNTPWYETRTYEERLPADVKKALDEHQKELAGMEYTVQSFDWLPGYIIKEDFREYPSNQFGYSQKDYEQDRIEGAKTFTSAIKAQRNPMFYIPQKYEYSAVGPDGNLKRYYISEKIPLSNEPITKEEAKAIRKFAYQTEWRDPQTGNFIKLAPGRIAIIDTEPRFSQTYKKRALREKINRQILLDPEPLSPEAIKYLKTKEIKYLGNRYSDYSPRPWYHVVPPKHRRWRFLVPPSKKSFYSEMGL